MSASAGTEMNGLKKSDSNSDIVNDLIGKYSSMMGIKDDRVLGTGSVVEDPEPTANDAQPNGAPKDQHIVSDRADSPLEHDLDPNSDSQGQSTPPDTITPDDIPLLKTKSREAKWVSDQNRAFVLTSPQNFAFEDRPVPKLQDPHDVLIRINVTGICGSDVHYWTNGRIGPFVVEKPLVLGHESSGTIVDTGSGVTTLKNGDRVALEPGVPCRRCTRCKEGKYNLCPSMAFAATPPFDGTLVKYYVLPEDLCYKLPANVSNEEGALLEPLAVAVHLVRQSGLKFNDSIVVFGAGPVGLLCCAVAHAFGAGKIVAVDIQEARLDFARKFVEGTKTFTPSSSSTSDSEENAQTLIDTSTLPRSGADIVIDASGAEPSIQCGIHVLRPGGTFVQGGMGKPLISFPITAACTKEINFRGSFRYASGDYEVALEMVASGRVKVGELVTGRYGFEEAERAFGDVREGRGIKVLIEGPR